MPEVVSANKVQTLGCTQKQHWKFRFNDLKMKETLEITFEYLIHMHFWLQPVIHTYE